MSILLEVCTDSASGAHAAEAGGADRVELCAALALGGVTPGPGLLDAALTRCALPIVVLVRPRAGDFVYDADDFRALLRDVECARAAGAHGVALGVLAASGEIDVERSRELVEAARPLEVCFHRAFDWTPDPYAALEALVSIGVDRVLTSGCAASAIDGLDCLERLVERAAGRIDILVGGGVRAHNAVRIIEATQAEQLHFTARESEASPQRRPEPLVPLGAQELPDDFERRPTRAHLVRELRATIEG